MKGSGHIDTIQALPQQAKVALCSALRYIKASKQQTERKIRPKLTVALMKSAYNQTTKDFQLPKVTSKSEFDALLARLEECSLITVDSRNAKVDARDRNVTINVKSADVKFALEDNPVLKCLLKKRKKAASLYV
mmetsp:Transcript_2481/g.2878  ORF Transcript_2481/g.2878 Transcript_2481/m.2878 type:complete len:134 (+) Transcript_2481:1-402(+)